MRASEAPEYWQEVLDAMNADDYKLAHKLAVKYKFATRSHRDKVHDVRHTPLKGDYVAMNPRGKMFCHEKANILSMHLGLSSSYVASAIKRVEKQGGYAQAGAMKGWEFWKE